MKGTLRIDVGRTLGYVRTIARRRADITLHEPITSIPAHYVPAPLLRESRD